MSDFDDELPPDFAYVAFDPFDRMHHYPHDDIWMRERERWFEDVLAGWMENLAWGESTIDLCPDGPDHEMYRLRDLARIGVAGSPGYGPHRFEPVDHTGEDLIYLFPEEYDTELFRILDAFDDPIRYVEKDIAALYLAGIGSCVSDDYARATPSPAHRIGVAGSERYRSHWHRGWERLSLLPRMTDSVTALLIALEPLKPYRLTLFCQDVRIPVDDALPGILEKGLMRILTTYHVLPRQCRHPDITASPDPT